jgi:hypothetical protein
MNDNSSSSNSSTSAPHHGLTAEAISRRAYEIWEKEGRPESRDLHHWLRAEQELLAERGQGGTSAPANPPRAQNTDTQPLQGTRAAAAAAKPTGKRATTPPFSGDKSTVRSSPPGAMRTGSRS